ncbi:unnamed protein product [Urochloa humidicola]
MFDSCFAQFKLDSQEMKNLAVGVSVTSEDVPAGGHVWRLKCFPHGDAKQANNGEYVSIFLQLVGNSLNVKAILGLHGGQG